MVAEGEVCSRGAALALPMAFTTSTRSVLQAARTVDCAMGQGCRAAGALYPAMAHEAGWWLAGLPWTFTQSFQASQEVVLPPHAWASSIPVATQ